MHIKWKKVEIFKHEDYAESRCDHKYKCKQTKNRSQFHLIRSVGALIYVNTINLFASSGFHLFVHQAAGERESR